MAGNGISYPGNGVSFIPGAVVPSDGAIVTDGTSATLTKVDGTGNLGTVTLDVAGGSVSGAALAGNLGVVTDNVSVNINQYDNSGSVAAAVDVLANAATFTLANATTRIVINGQSTNIRNVSGSKAVGGTIVVDQGALTGVTLAALNAMVTNNVGLQVPVTGTYTNTITPQVDANGVITGFTLS